MADLTKRLESEMTKVAQHRATEPGRRELAFLELMGELRLKREAYHGGAFVGDDIHAVMDPAVIERFVAILSEITVTSKLKVSTDGTVQMPLRTLGAPKAAAKLRELCLSFSDAMALFGRGTPLCEHHISAFQQRTDRYARAYARALPSDQPQPKTHALCAEMPDQAERMGGPGMLGESVIEGMHVRDNALKRRHATTTEVCENLRLRAQGMDRMGDTRVANIQAVEEEANRRKRSKKNHASRKRKNHA
eukprot:1494450-Prymnesium_polylepis.1